MEFLITALIQGLAFTALGCGVYLSLRILRVPDITTDGSYTLGGCVTAVMISNHYPPFIVLVLVIIAGLTAGFITGIIHTRFKVNALLSGILVTTALYSVNLLLLGRPNLPVSDSHDYYSYFTQQGSTGYLTGTLVFIILLLAVISIFLLTDKGIALRAAGDSETMARAQGIATNRMKTGGLALANACTAMSGYLLVQYQGFADINMGIGIVITGLGAVMIGEVMLRQASVYKPWKQLCAVLAGSIIFRMVLAASLSAGLDPVYLRLFTSAIVLLIVVAGNRNKLTI